MSTPEFFAAEFLLRVETGFQDVEAPEYLDDPRTKRIASALRQIGVQQVEILGSGSFGVAAATKDNRVVKLTVDASEVEAATVLRGKFLGHVVRIDGAWNVRGVTVEHYEVGEQWPVGIVLMERVEVIDTSLDPIRSTNNLTLVWARVRSQMRALPSQLRKMTRAQARDRLLQTSIVLEDELRARAKETRWVTEFESDLMNQVADGLHELRDVGVYAIDVHQNNVGFSARDGVYKLFDIGSSSSPPNAPTPEQLPERESIMPGMVEEGVRVEEIGEETASDQKMPSIWYHLTDRAKFKLDPKFAPEDNAIAIEDRSGQPGIYLGRSVERWVNGYGYWRPFVVEIRVDPSVVNDPGVHGRYGGEMFVPAASFGKLKIERVIPLDAYAREEFGESGWIEGALGVAFDTGEPVDRKTRYRGYHYAGPDVRDMSHEEADRLKRDLRKVKGHGAGEAKRHRRAVRRPVWNRGGDVIELPINQIQIRDDRRADYDAAWWQLHLDPFAMDPNAEVDWDRVRKYVEISKREPVTVVLTDGRYGLLDGYHRFVANKLAGSTTMRVEVVPEPSEARERRRVAKEADGRIKRTDCAHIQKWLYEYLKTEVDPYDFNFAIKDWIEQEEITDDGTPYVDPDDVAPEDLSEEQLKAFTKWLKRSGELDTYVREMPFESPAYLTLHARTMMPAGSWFIHFTNAPSFQHFTQGATLDGLHLSTWKERKDLADCSRNLSEEQGLAEVVFGFAYAAENMETMRDIRAGANKYGQHAVIFQNDCAVEAYHDGDNELQSIFPVCSEYNLHEVSIDSYLGLGLDDGNGNLTWFKNLAELTASLERKPKRRKTHAAEAPIRVDLDMIEAGAERVADHFSRLLRTPPIDDPQKAARWFFDRANNHRGPVVVGDPQVEFEYFTPFKHGTIRTVRGRQRIDKIMLHPILMWTGEPKRPLVLDAYTMGGVAFTGYASIWMRVNASSAYAKDLRDHPGQFTNTFASMLLHEVTHLRDYIRPGDVIDPNKRRGDPVRGWNDFVAYVNSVHEVRAYEAQIVYECIRFMEHPGGKLHRRRAELMRDNPNQWLVDEALAHSKQWDHVGRILNEKNRARVLKAVYRALDEEGMLIQQAAPRLPRSRSAKR